MIITFRNCDIGWLGKLVMKNISSWTRTFTKYRIMSKSELATIQRLIANVLLALGYPSVIIGKQKTCVLHDHKSIVVSGPSRHSRSTKWDSSLPCPPPITFKISLPHSNWYAEWIFSSVMCFVSMLIRSQVLTTSLLHQHLSPVVRQFARLKTSGIAWSPVWARLINIRHAFVCLTGD